MQILQDVFENHGTDRFAARIPVSGTFEEVETNGWAALIGVLSNTLIRAIERGIEGPSASWTLEPRRRGG